MTLTELTPSSAHGIIWGAGIKHMSLISKAKLLPAILFLQLQFAHISPIILTELSPDTNRELSSALGLILYQMLYELCKTL